MTRNPLSLFSSALFAAALFIPAIIQAQIPGGSSAREIPNEVQKADPRVDRIIEKAESYFHEAEIHLAANELNQAREKFDKSVDEILESGLDVRGTQRLQDYYLRLIERVYRLEVQVSPRELATPVIVQATPNQKAETVEVAQVQQPKQVGFVQQGFEPSPLDPLSRLILTETEQQVSEMQLADLEQAKNSLDFNFTINPLVQQYINFY